ncbi:O-antigen ligase family protein [Arcobacter porcinus]|uniref:O-antigen ligase family protein n=1 Tax=Arcobacter porcinus TaxID=1935204 RepID=UPI00081D76C5|nr:O-antigen ligase family protein [Arcobacter porcinus]OCL83918.1 O-Antigen ligase [Arcobacter porcinus]
MRILNLNKEAIEPFKIFIYLWILILPWDFTKGIMGNFSIIMVVWWLIIGKRRGYFIKLKELLYNKSLFLFLLFLIYAYLSLLWTDNIKFGFDQLNFYKYYIVVIPIIYTVLSKEDIQNALYILIISFGIYALFSLSIYFGLVEIKGSNPSNPKGILAYALVTVYMAISSLMAFYFYLNEENKKMKYFMLFISVISFIALFTNNGRIGQISFFATIFILMIYHRQYLIEYKKTLILFIISILFGFSLLYSFGKLDRFIIGAKELIVLENTQFAGSWGHRAYMWYAAADGVSNHPFFGAGVGDIIDEFIEYGNKNPSKATWLRSYHNQHLDYLTKFGIVGYILFLSSIYVLLKSLYKEDKYFFIVGLIFFSIVLVDSLGDIILLMKPFNNIFVLVFVLLAIIVNKKHLEKKDAI